MKIYNFALPMLFAFLSVGIQPSSIDNTSSFDNTIESEAVEVINLDDELFWPKKKKQGPLVANQDFTACNTCASCSPSCLESDAACAGAIISINTIYCPEFSPKGNISFPGNNQFVCSLTVIGPYTWYVEFNVVAYSCSFPDTPFTFDIPVQLEWVCPGTANNVTSTNLNFIIC